eukprot:SAG31_NODE_457_length_15415_cov_4.380387_15_plen_76_part_00
MDLAQVSTYCDELVRVLNDKCVKDIANHTIVFPLIQTLNMLNGGQGLGVRTKAPSYTTYVELPLVGVRLTSRALW